jgi:hypothetical protein
VNVELATASLGDAKAHPEQFDMEYWVVSAADLERAEQLRGGEDFVGDPIPVADDHMPPCGTTCCYAGWVAFRAAPAGSVIQDSVVTFPDGTRSAVSPFAADALGITLDQSRAIFLYLGEIGEVERAVNYLAENPDACFDCVLDAAAGRNMALAVCGG